MALSAQLALDELQVAKERFHKSPTNTNQCLVWAAQGRAAGLGLDVTSQGVCTGGGGLTGGAPTRAEYDRARNRWINMNERYNRLREEGKVGWQILNPIRKQGDRLFQEYLAIQRAYLAAQPPGGAPTRDEYLAARQRMDDAEKEYDRLRREGGVSWQFLQDLKEENHRLVRDYVAIQRAYFAANPRPPSPPPPQLPPLPPPPPPLMRPMSPIAGSKRRRGEDDEDEDSKKYTEYSQFFKGHSDDDDDDEHGGGGPVSGGANEVDLTEEPDSVHVEPDWSQFAAPLGQFRRSPIDVLDSDDEYQLDYEGEDAQLGVMLRQLRGITSLLNEKRDEYFRGMTPSLLDEVNRLTDLKDRMRQLYKDAVKEREEFRDRRLRKNPDVNNMKPRGESVADDTGLEGMGVKTRS